MRKTLSFVSAALLALVCLATTAAAQTVSVQQSATPLDAVAIYATSASSAATITVTPPSGQFFYLTNVEITNCAGSSAVTAAAVTTVTTTNLGGGTTPAWTIGSGVAAGLCQPSPVNGPFPHPLKSNAAGTAVTFVLPTFATNQTVRVSVYGYYGS